MTKISVITPTKNSERHILETLESIHNQGYPEVEHIIVDGLSRDSTLDIVKDFMVSRSCRNIRIIVKEDKNMYEAINTGLAEVTGDIYAYLNSDDCYRNGAFETVARYFDRHNHIDMIYGNCHYVDENGDTLFWSNNPPFNFGRLVRARTSWIQQPGTFYRRRVLEKVGYFNTNYSQASDYDYLLRVGKTCSVARIRAALVNFRVYSKSLTQLYPERTRKETEEIQREYIVDDTPVEKLLRIMDYIQIYSLLIRPRNFKYMLRKLGTILRQ